MDTTPGRAHRKLSRRFAVAFFYLAAGLFAIALPHFAQQPPAALPLASAAHAPAPHIPLDGVSNFAQVSDHLYRGAQPSDQGFQGLKKMGVAIVVNFRNERGETQSEQQTVTSLGLTYVGIPWSALHDPTDQQVAQFLELVRANPDKKIFVHCQAGADRTGIMIAVYRMSEQGWTPAEAEAEMHAYHFHSLFFHHLKSFADRFPQLFITDTTFAPLRPAAPASNQ